MRKLTEAARLLVQFSGYSHSIQNASRWPPEWDRYSQSRELRPCFVFRSSSV